MNKDYSWIKKGVKAELINGVRCSELNGTIVTISSDPELIDCVNTEVISMCVRIEESKELADKYGYSSMVIPVINLKPFNPPNWEGIADGSVHCKHDFRRVTGEAIISYMEDMQ